MIPLSRVAQTPMWQCLLDVYRSLGAGIALIDDRFSLVPVATKGPAALGDLELDDETKERVASAFAGQRAIMLSRNDRHTSCTPVIHGGTTVGGVLVTADQPHLNEAQLVRAGVLLAHAIEDELVESRADVALLSRRIAALHQLLHASADQGSARDVVLQFVEALSIWEDAEIFGYCADLNGRRWLEVALPGSDRSSVPVVIEADRVPPDVALLPISRADKEELGFRATADTVLATVMTDAGPWLLAVNADFHAPDRFELYLAALRVALPAALARESARLTWAMMQHFVEATSPEQGAARALAALGAAVGEKARLSAWNGGRVALSIGAAIAEGERAPMRSASVLRARFDASNGLTAVLDVLATEGRRGFSVREQTLFEAAVDNVRTWLATAAAQMAIHSERRRGQRSFEEIVERYLRDGDGVREAALILISPAGASPSPQTSSEWIRHVRPQLRPTDLTGRLASGDVAILALDTQQPGASVVAHRIAQIVGAMGQPGQPVVRVGVAAAAGSWSNGNAVIDRSRLQVVDSSPSVG